MSLPSQSSRGVSRQSAVHYRRRQVGPARRALPFMVIAAAIALVWFVFLKPGPTKAGQPAVADSRLEQEHDQEPEARSDAVEIANRNPSSGRPGRELPGAGEQPDPVEEVEVALKAPAQVVPRSEPRGSDGRRVKTGSLLDTAANQADRSGSATTSTAGESTPRSASRSEPATHRIEARRQPTVASGPSRIRIQMDTARRLIAENDRVAARALLSKTLRDEGLTDAEAEVVRSEITAINEELVFGPIVAPGDPMCEEYRVQSGDSLSRIAGRRELATHWKLIQRVNRISNPSRIRLNQRVKLVRGPFHAVVHKREHRMDIYHGSPDDPGNWVFIRSFRVGLGEANGTPTGEFVVNDSKLENPGWVNPRNPGERYEPNDPNNPIGEFWIGLDGLGEHASKTGYGIHGTVERESIGQNMSMGCVRLADDDIAVVYELLGMHVSRIEIRP